ncbi:MAG: hypothetical protein E7378_02370 [Clostridiales bacterium]|nr:hypothetical protein [Clostridiales bacterium]
MKKALVIILIFCCFVFAGCSQSGTVGMINYSDGSIREYYYIPYAEKEMLNAGLTVAESEAIKNRIEQQGSIIFNNYINDYKLRISKSEKYTNEQKLQLMQCVKLETPSSLEIQIGGGMAISTVSYFEFDLLFANQTAYLEFKEANADIKEQKTVQEIKTLFTTTTKVVKDPIFDKIVDQTVTLGQNCVKMFQDVMTAVVGEARWQNIKEAIGYDDAAQKFDYCYVVPSARIHTNAPQQFSKDGYYYHVWQVDANNNQAEAPMQFQVWTTTANKWAWYVLALIVSGAIIATIYFVGRKKERTQNQNTQDKAA